MCAIIIGYTSEGLVSHTNGVGSSFLKNANHLVIINYLNLSRKPDYDFPCEGLRKCPVEKSLVECPYHFCSEESTDFVYC